jgi:nucleoside-diphosphate-sugar epimerase
MERERVRRALVTGATGYIGSRLVERLLELHWRVTAVKRPSSNLDKLEHCAQSLAFFDYDGTTESLRQALESARPDVVFHLASLFVARHRTAQIESIIESNVLLGTQLLEAMQLTDVGAIVNASTAWQTSGGLEYNPTSLYAATKQAFEDILTFYSNVYGISSVSLRLPDTYGPDDTRPKILNLVKKAAQTGEILRMSSGEQEMDMLYIDDVVDGFTQAVEQAGAARGSSRVYSLTSGAPTSLRGIVELYQVVNDVSVNIEWGALPYRPNEIMKVTVPNNVLPFWKCRVSLEDGLRRMGGTA